MTWRDRLETPLGRGLVLGALALAVYLLTRTRDFGGDDTVYALAVDRLLAGKGGSRELWHPHHPLFNPLVAGVAWLLRLVGLDALTLDVGAGVSATCAAGSVGCLAALLTAERLPAWAVWSTCVAAATCGGLWDIATTMEVYCLGALAVVAWLAAVSRAAPRGAVVGAALALAILGHLVLGLLVAPTAVLLWRRPRELGRALVVGLGVSGLAMVLVLALAHGVSSPEGVRQALSGDGLGAYLVPPDPRGAAAALRRLVAWGWFDRVQAFPVLQGRLLHVAGTVAALVLAALAVVGVAVARQTGSALARSAAWGVAAFLPLWLVWDTGNVEHVVAATPLLAALVAVGAATLASAPARVALAAAAALTTTVNGLGSAIPQARAELSRPLLVATFVATRLPAGTVVASTGRDARLRLSLPYLSGRHVTDLTRLVGGAVARGLPAEAGLDAWLAELGAAHRLVLLPDVTDPTTAPFVAGLGIPTAAWQSTLARLEPVSRITLQADGAAILEPFTLTEAVLRPAATARRPVPELQLPDLSRGGQP